MENEMENGPSELSRSAANLTKRRDLYKEIKPVGLNGAANRESETARRLRLLKQSLIIFLVSLGSWVSGSCLSFPSVMAYDLTHHNTTIFSDTINPTPVQLDLLSSVLPLGSMLGTLLMTPLMTRLGRLTGMAVMGIGMVMGWLGVALFPFFYAIVIARFVLGIGIGGISLATNAYSVEVSDVEIRGRMNFLISIGVLCGQAWILCVGYDTRYFIAALISLALPLAFLLGLLWLPESPSFLILKGRDEEAKSVLRTLRGGHADVEAEVGRYKALNAEMQGEMASWRGLLQRDILKRLLVSSSLFVIKSFTGYFVVGSNGSRIFQDAGSSISGNLATLILVFIQLGASVVGTIFVDIIGRRKSLLTSFLLMGTSLFGMAVYNAYTDEGGEGQDEGGEGRGVKDYGWVPLLCLVVSQAAGYVGLFPVCFTLAAEYFPTWIRAQAFSVASCTFYLSGMVSLQLYSLMLEGLGRWGLYIFYASVCVLGIPFTLVFVKETMGEIVG